MDQIGLRWGWPVELVVSCANEREPLHVPCPTAESEETRHPFGMYPLLELGPCPHAPKDVQAQGIRDRAACIAIGCTHVPVGRVDTAVDCHTTSQAQQIRPWHMTGVPVADVLVDDVELQPSCLPYGVHRRAPTIIP